MRLCFHPTTDLDSWFSLFLSPAETTLFILGNLKLLSLPHDHHPSVISVCPSVYVLMSKCVLFKLLLCAWSTTLECTLGCRGDGVGTLGLCSCSPSLRLWQRPSFNIQYSTWAGTDASVSHTLALPLFMPFVYACLSFSFLLVTFPCDCHLNFLQTCRKE